MPHPAKKIEDWFAKSHRPLPWRAHYKPYEIWISEIMLQQTQVNTVIPYFQRFLTAFPNVEALAHAPESEVLGLWSGLGYYSRARNLQKGARSLLSEHGGKFPKTRAEILQIPGIGPYTAGAILSIAFNLPVPIVDGNVVRVMSRYYGISTPVEASESKSAYWERATEWVTQAKTPRNLNQGMMELGATVCAKSNPNCKTCPISRGCFARVHAIQESLPPPKKRKATVDIHWLGLLYESDEHYFLTQNKAGEWWEGLWDLPHIEMKESSDAPKLLSQILRKNPQITSTRSLGIKKHTVTHHRIELAAFLCRTEKRAHSTQGRWFTRSELEKLPVSSLVNKVLSAVPPLPHSGI